MHPITFTVSLPGQTQPLTVNLTDLLVCFQTVPDQRKRRGVRYPLPVLLTIAVLAKLSGQSQVHTLADWAAARAVELTAVFGLSHARMPHPTTWTRILGYGVTADAVEAALQTMLSAPTAEVLPRASRHVALDGKTLRGTIPAHTTCGVHLLSVYQVQPGITLREVAVGTKANELTAAPALLAQLDLTGMLVSGDAMFTQQSLSTQIVEAGRDYCWIVKKNQPTLYDDLRLLFGPQPAVLPGTSPTPDDFVTVRTVEKAHGRLEVRELTSVACWRTTLPGPIWPKRFRWCASVNTDAAGTARDAMGSPVSRRPLRVRSRCSGGYAVIGRLKMGSTIDAM